MGSSCSSSTGLSELVPGCPSWSGKKFSLADFWARWRRRSQNCAEVATRCPNGPPRCSRADSPSAPIAGSQRDTFPQPASSPRFPQNAATPPPIMCSCPYRCKTDELKSRHNLSPSGIGLAAVKNWPGRPVGHADRCRGSPAGSIPGLLAAADRVRQCCLG